MFVYAAFDKPGQPPLYLGEALVSARSLRRHTDRPIRLVTAASPVVERLAARADFPFNEVTFADPGGAPFKAQKIRAIGEASGDVVFLDADTIILADLSRVFEVGPFDLAAVVVPVRRALTTMDHAVRLELSHRGNLNSGVLFIRSKAAAGLSAAWLRHFEAAVAEKGASAYDQPALRAAVAELKPDVLTLPHNYNFRAPFGGLLSGACFVIHTHFTQDVRRLAEADFDPGAMDRLIDHVAKVNNPVANEVMAPVRGHSVMRVDWSRGAGRSLPRRLLRALRG